MTALKTIYDFGSNNGDDIPYYLLRADRVVAVEANPELCRVINARFANQVASGRVIVINCVLTDDESRTETPFYIHNTRHVCSQLPKPVKHLSDFTEVTLPCATAASIIAKHGPAYYIKIDIERYDGPILRNLFMHGVVPPYISAEAHDVSVFALLVALGGYNAFKLVDGASVAELYKEIGRAHV